MDGLPQDLTVGNRVHDVLSRLCSLLDIHVTFFDAHFEPVSADRDRPPCGYCRLLQTDLGLLSRCRQEDRAKLAEARDSGKPTFYRCFAGLQEAILPVRHAGQHIGYAMIGQWRSTDLLPADFENAAEQVRQAFESVTFFPEQQTEAILETFEALVNSAAALDVATSDAGDALTQIVSVLRNNPATPLSLPDAARIAGRSVSTVSHLFTERTGKSFKRTQIEARIAAAERILRDEPGVAIKEVAFQVGYDDPLYFSRIFKKYRGVPPSAIRQAAATSRSDRDTHLP